jgi:glucoamylase
LAELRGNGIAFGRPRTEPRSTQAPKAGVGTAYATFSRPWLTVWNGIITEAYYPTIDRPQIRDLSFVNFLTSQRQAYPREI